MLVLVCWLFICRPARPYPNRGRPFFYFFFLSAVTAAFNIISALLPLFSGGSLNQAEAEAENKDGCDGVAGACLATPQLIHPIHPSTMPPQT
jgi:hypothetical protein